MTNNRGTPSQTDAPSEEQAEAGSAEANPLNPHLSGIPKFETLAPLTVRLRHDQVAMLADFERKIMSQRHRGERRERITKSTIIRSLIDLLPELLNDTRGIADEAALCQRLCRRRSNK